MSPKNRVWDFFELSNETRPATRRHSPQPRRKIRPAATKPASGIPCWPSRDPIGERGGINLYGVLANNGLNGLDYIGLDFIAVGANKVKVGTAKLPVYHMIVHKWKSSCPLNQEEMNTWTTKEKMAETLKARGQSLGELAGGIDAYPQRGVKWKIPLDYTTTTTLYTMIGPISHTSSGLSEQSGLVVTLVNLKQNNKGQEMYALFSGSDEEVSKKWNEIVEQAKNYRFGEQAGYTTLKHFPNSFYGDIPGWGSASGPLDMPFNTSNTFAKTILAGAKLDISAFGVSFPGNYPAKELSLHTSSSAEAEGASILTETSYKLHEPERQ